MLIAFGFYRRAESAKQDAVSQKFEAVDAKLAANEQALKANLARDEAEKARDEGESLKKKAVTARRQIERQARELRKQIEQTKRAEQRAADFEDQLNRLRVVEGYATTSSPKYIPTSGSASGTAKRVTEKVLRQIMPTLPEAKSHTYLPFLPKVMDEFEINTPLRQAAFLAQVAHETAELRYLVEPWVPTVNQLSYERSSSRAKALGNTEPGDGFRYRGRGVFLIVGRSNYKRYGELLGVDLVNNPDLAATPNLAFAIGALFWKVGGLNERADAGDFTQITRRINGGLNSLAERQKYYERSKKALGVLDSQQTR